MPHHNKYKNRPCTTAFEVTSAVTAVANAIACKLTSEELAFLASVLVQLGDTLATIGAVQSCRLLHDDKGC